jgi:hypothetical protein
MADDYFRGASMFRICSSAALVVVFLAPAGLTADA